MNAKNLSDAMKVADVFAECGESPHDAPELAWGCAARLADVEDHPETRQAVRELVAS